MKNILLLAVILAFATFVLADATTHTFKYGLFRDDCFEAFFTKHDFTNGECLKLTLSKLVGFAIIAGSAILKVPQIVKILKAGSVEGISKILFYVETLQFINGASWSIKAGIPFSVYGEQVIILVQNAIIILLFWTYSKTIGLPEKLVLFFAFTTYSFLLFSGNRYLGEEAWFYIEKMNMVLLLPSKLPQIMDNFWNKSTGQLAFFSFLLSFLGGIARLGTVLIETDDLIYQLQFLIGVLLNGVIVIQFVLYWNNKPAQVAQGKPGSKTDKPDSASPKKRREKIE